MIEQEIVSRSAWRVDIRSGSGGVNSALRNSIGIDCFCLCFHAGARVRMPLRTTTNVSLAGVSLCKRVTTEVHQEGDSRFLCACS